MTTGTKFAVGEYKTRSGEEAKVLFIPKACGPLIGARKFGDSWISEMWFANGQAKAGEQSPHDLMPPLREWWLYAGISINSKDHADRLRKSQPDAEIIHVREVPDDQA